MGQKQKENPKVKPSGRKPDREAKNSFYIKQQDRIDTKKDKSG